MKKKKNIVENEYNKKFSEYKEKNFNLNKNDIDDILISDLKKIVDENMKKSNEEKRKVYEKFKKMKLSKLGKENNNNSIINIYNIRKVLGLRTHSKKTKRRGRKKLINNNNNNNNSVITDSFINLINDNNYNNIKNKNEFNYDINKMSNKNYNNNINIYNINKINNNELNQNDIHNNPLSAFKNLDSNESTEMKTPMYISQILKPIKIVSLFDYNSPCKNQIKNYTISKIDNNINPQKNLNIIFDKLE